MALDDAFVDRVRRGEGAAWRELYDTLAPKVVGYLASRGVRDAPDVTQEVFLHVFQKATSIRGGESGLRTFVFSVAHARMVDHFRSAARRPTLVEHTQTMSPRPEPSAEDTAVDNEAVTRALSLLEPLTDEQRDVIAMRIVAELSIEETAAALGRTAGSVKQLQRRGIEALRVGLGSSEMDRTERGQEARP